MSNRLLHFTYFLSFKRQIKTSGMVNIKKHNKYRWECIEGENYIHFMVQISCKLVQPAEKKIIKIREVQQPYDLSFPILGM